LRLGIVSAHIRKHSVWDALLKGILQHLDRSRIDIDIFHLGAQADAETAWARANCAHFDQGPHAPERWTEHIRARRPDVLLYPEIGMDLTTTYLASQRLADLQVATWGHPHTSGLPTIDCFFSAAALEPGDAQRHYTERLICLPRLGCCVAPAHVEALPVDLAALGISPDRPLLLSPGTPYKYAPQHDWVFPAIARRLGRCTIAFFVDRSAPWSSVYDTVLDRLSTAFSARGSRFSDHCVVVPWQQRGAFQGLLQRADLMLDTIGFSGFNTALQAVECGLPIVTREGRFMRGRLAGGVLGALGLEELIAVDEQAYVDLVVSLATDPDRLRSLRRRIDERRHVLFGDVETVGAFEKYIVELSGRRSLSGPML
jgi:predicted O-linked N-acetylglucosamine transferase (SPINDLY family)